MNEICRQFRSANRVSRRCVLRAGGLGLLGGGLFGMDRVSSAPPNVSKVGDTGFGRAKACIFLFMWGGPSQLDTFDMKPDAPAEIRGDFKQIATTTPGLQICEHFSRLANQTDKIAVIRSLSHTDPAHLSSAHATVTGHLAPVVNSDRDPPSDRDTPHLGSMMARLRITKSDMPSSVILPWKTFHPAAPGGQSPGQHGGWLGAKYDPLLLTGDPNHPKWQAPALKLIDGVSVERLNDRRSLLTALDRQREGLNRAGSAQHWNDHQQNAFRLLTAPDTAKAFDLSQESAKTRDRYGRNTHGQCVLLARRLVERGVPVVNVNWQNDGRGFWDTHGDNFNRLKKHLIPQADQALTTLLEDLDERGMLNETIVAWVGEFGRKPQITKKGAGREHWPRCYSGLLAGAGIGGGATYGASDKHAAYPTRNPISPQDYAATIFYAMGVDLHQTLNDRDGRPHRVCEGKPLSSLFGTS